VKIVEPSVELLSCTVGAARLIETAGRTCYQSGAKTTSESSDVFVGMIKALGHDAMLEFGWACIRIITDRGVSHELVRHRLFSFAQESTRYCNYSKRGFEHEICVIDPSKYSNQPGFRDTWLEAVKRAEAAYIDLVCGGTPPQIARSILPTCLKTEICVAGNFREWLHFLKLRTAPAAHPQMREIAEMCRQVLLNECPAVFKETA